MGVDIGEMHLEGQGAGLVVDLLQDERASSLDDSVWPAGLLNAALEG